MIAGLISRIQEFRKTEFFVALTTTGFGTALQMLCGLVVGKIIAIKVGPGGIALLGQFTDFKALLTTAGTGAFGSGVTKLVADPDYDENKVVSTSTVFSVVVCAVLSVAVFFFSDRLSTSLLGSVNYSYIFSLFSLFIVFFSLNNILLAAINGRRAFGLLLRVQIINSLIALFSSGLLCWFLSLKGAFIASVVNLPLAFALSLAVVYLQSGRGFRIRLSSFDWRTMKALFAFTAMGVMSLVLAPLVGLLIRNFIIVNDSYESAGLWGAMVRISGYYGSVISMALGAYYLPKLSSLKQSAELRREIFSGIKVIMPIYVLMAIVIYFCRHLFIFLLFSPEFAPMERLFLPLLVGDFFKFLSFLVAYMLWAKAMTRTFICLQLLFATSRICLVVILFEKLGVVGVLWASAGNYILYGLTMAYIFRDLLFKHENTIIR